MLKVPLRDFQLKPSEYLDKLPIALTRYDKVIAYVLTDIDYESKSVNTIKPDDTLSINDVKAAVKALHENSIKNLTEPIPTAEQIEEASERPVPMARCKVPGCKQEAFENGWHWEDGNWYQIPMCDKHAKESELAHSKADL